MPWSNEDWEKNISQIRVQEIRFISFYIEKNLASWENPASHSHILKFISKLMLSLALPKQREMMLTQQQNRSELIDTAHVPYSTTRGVKWIVLVRNSRWNLDELVDVTRIAYTIARMSVTEGLVTDVGNTIVELMRDIRLKYATIFNHMATSEQMDADRIGGTKQFINHNRYGSDE